MSSRGSLTKFSCGTSRFLLPTFRRPCYREIMDAPVDSLAAEGVFRRWTQEQGQYYHLINTSLLNDDLDVLKKNVQFINNLRQAIRSNTQNESIKVYRGLCIAPEDVKKEYKVGLQFLWPTFTCTSKNKEVAQDFGDHLFEIEAPSSGVTYRTDISKYSDFPEEEEILFYPYSGFEVKEILSDAKVIKLKSVDTNVVEASSEKKISDKVTISDPSRNMSVQLCKRDTHTYWWYNNNPSQRYIIEANQNGYWDAPYRYHHCNGYFIDKGEGVWEEYHREKFFARFQRVD